MERTGFSVLDQVGSVLGDTSFFFAVADPADAHHSFALEISQEVLARQIRIFTTWEVVVECVALLRYRLGFWESKQFLSGAPEVLSILYPDEWDRRAAIEFYLKRSVGRRLSLCNAMS